MVVNSHRKVQLPIFISAGSIFSVKLLGFMSKAIKLLLAELVGQSRNILPLAFSALASLLLVST